MIDVTAWVETGDWLSGEAGREPAWAFAGHALERRFRKLLKRGCRLEARDDAARHRVRIEAKKLRYAAEGFAALFPEKKVERSVGRLKALQELTRRAQRHRHRRADALGTEPQRRGRLRRRRA